jgi:anti-anti-sigma factor
MDWTLETKRDGGTTHVVPRGELDLVTAPLLARALHEAERSADERILLDLSDVSFMDSSGLATVLEAVQRGREADDRRLSIEPGQGPVVRLLTLADLLDELPLVRG